MNAKVKYLNLYFWPHLRLMFNVKDMYLEKYLMIWKQSYLLTSNATFATVTYFFSILYSCSTQKCRVLG